MSVPPWAADGLSRSDHLYQEVNSGVYPFRRWRARPDSNRLPPAVLAGVLPEAPLTHIRHRIGGEFSQSFGNLLFYLQLICAISIARWISFWE